VCPTVTGDVARRAGGDVVRLWSLPAGLLCVNDDAGACSPVSARFQELDWCPTRLGDLVLRRRWDPAANKEVYEVKLGEEFLMSSLFTVAEVQLAHRALHELEGGPLVVVVGGLGLGYTAQAVLEDPRVGRLVVVEALSEVIGWHKRRLVPAGASLTADSRCRLVHGDFFAMLRNHDEFDPQNAGRRFDAVIVDIDHSPRHLLHPSHADLYRPSGLQSVAERLRPGGVFALWSNDPPDESFLATAGEVFGDVRAEVISFDNPLQGRVSTNTVYIATS
jgi:SAM-dependent methyltransferase